MRICNSEIQNHERCTQNLTGQSPGLGFLSGFLPRMVRPTLSPVAGLSCFVAQDDGTAGDGVPGGSMSQEDARHHKKVIMNIQAKPTQYNGQSFRSRLEAQWAVFFDAVGLRWSYEPNAWKLTDRQWYTPDFALRDARAWVEIKPPIAIDEGLIDKYDSFAEKTQHPLWLIYGPPAEGQYDVYWLPFADSRCELPFVFAEGRACEHVYLMADLAYSPVTCSGEGTCRADRWPLPHANSIHRGYVAAQEFLASVQGRGVER